MTTYFTLIIRSLILVKTKAEKNLFVPILILTDTYLNYSKAPAIAQW